jgi:hypothetical protein
MLRRFLGIPALCLVMLACSSSSTVGGDDIPWPEGTVLEALDGDDPLGEGFNKETDSTEPAPEEAEAPTPEEPAPEVAEPEVEPELFEEEVQVPPCDEGEGCDDDDPCTYDDTCTEGACHGLPYTCEDEYFCTEDVCLGDGECDNPLRGGFCFIDDVCWWDGDLSPENPCQECITAVRPDDWTNDDTNFCHEPGTCVTYSCSAGECVQGPKSCDDGNPCTEDACQAAVGCTHLPVEGPCDDKNVCTIDDFCYGGTCQPGLGSLDCNDHNPCTNDTCDAKQGCQHPGNSEPCDDLNICTVNDRCSGGECGGEPLACPDDGNPCTTEACYPEIGCFSKDNQDPCDDGDFCTTGDVCIGGACVPGTGAPPCDDGNACTDDLCDSVSGCYHQDNFLPCNDGDVCSIGDHCLSGGCVAGQYKIYCYDANPCTSDACDPELGCNYPPNGAPCDDHNVCTEGDYCGEVYPGMVGCVGGEERLRCDDLDPCTNDYCHPIEGCFHEPNHAWCEDGDPCTGGDHCVMGDCIPGNEEVLCEDWNPCTTEACVKGVGCVTTPIEAACNDDNECTPVDQCVNGECQGFGSVFCDDGNQCTDDFCESHMGCLHDVVQSFACMPKLFITWPPRGIQLLDPVPSDAHYITVTGYVDLPAAPAIALRINDQPVTIKPDKTFAHQMQVHQGLNVIDAWLRDTYYEHDHVVQTFQMSGKYYPLEEGVPNAIGVLLGQEVLDDQDHTTKDDLATFILDYVRTLNLAAMLPPNPVVSQSFAWCDVDVNLHGLYYTFDDIRLALADDYLYIIARIKNLGIPFDVDVDGFLCSLASTSGHVDAGEVSAYFAFRPHMDDAGNVTIERIYSYVTITEMHINVDNSLVSFLMGMFQNQIDTMMNTMLDPLIGDFIDQALEGIALSLVLEQDFEFPIPFLNKTISFHLSGFPSTFTIVPGQALAIGYKVNLTVPDKGVPYEYGPDKPIKGSISNSDCMFNAWSPHKFAGVDNLDEFGVALWDDLINKVVFSAWWGGLMEIELDADTIAGLLGDSEMPIPGLVINQLHISAMLPPDVSTCGLWSGTPTFEIGDIRVDANVDMGGMAINAVMYATALGHLKVTIPYDGTTHVSFGVSNIEALKIEIAELNDEMFGMRYALEDLIADLLGPILDSTLANLTLFTFDLPALDLGALVPGAPPISLKVKLNDLTYSKYGDIIIKGQVDAP